MNYVNEEEWVGRLAIKDIGDRLFSIPSYQRGYRWKKENVEALLEDLYDFYESKNALYCLQPLVLKYVKESNKWRVVDGQQRLTTITLILKTYRENCPWTIMYEEENRALEDLLADDEDMSINADFRRYAIDTINKWGDKYPAKKEKVIKALACKVGDVAFIEYRIGNSAVEQDVFKRLNTGKIPLTSSELIKALFMVESSGLNEAERMEISKEWELIEVTLRDNRVWSMLRTDGYASFTRIDLLFGMTARISVGKLKADHLAIYNAIEKVVRLDEKGERRTKEERAEKLKEIWRAILHIYWWVESCYGDTQVHNYLGWFSKFSTKTASDFYVLYEDWKLKNNDVDDCKKEYEMGKFNVFKSNLAIMLGEELSNIFPSGIENVEYRGNNQLELRKLFVALNVLFCNNRDQHFRFDKYNAEESRYYWDKEENKRFRGGWDIEHIDAKNGAKISQVNNIHNLVLLDAKTNRDYKDACFAEKRDWIRRNLEDPDFYVLPCTESVFMKFFSNDGDNSAWTEKDGDSYRDAMVSLFKNSLQGR